jgi:hypothetical protein
VSHTIALLNFNIHILQFFPPFLYCDMTIRSETLIRHFRRECEEQTINAGAALNVSEEALNVSEE